MSVKRDIGPFFFSQPMVFSCIVWYNTVEFYAKAVSVMKAQRPYLQVSITPKGEAALLKGHPWVYEGEVTAVSGEVVDGELVDVVSRKGSWGGSSFFRTVSA